MLMKNLKSYHKVLFKFNPKLLEHKQNQMGILESSINPKIASNIVRFSIIFLHSTLILRSSQCHIVLIIHINFIYQLNLLIIFPHAFWKELLIKPGIHWTRRKMLESHWFCKQQQSLLGSPEINIKASLRFWIEICW